MIAIIRHDFCAGIQKLKGKLLVFMIIVLICGIAAITEFRDSGETGSTFAEIVAYSLGGVAPFMGERENVQGFQMPVFWMVIQLYIAYVLGSYPIYDKSRYGIMLLLRTKNRKKWWAGKVIWTLIMISVLYFIMYILFFCMSDQRESWWKIRSAYTYIYNADYSILGLQEICLLIFILPILTACALALLQLLMIFATNPIVAYGITGFLCAGSAFYESPFFIANNSMMIRSLDKIAVGATWETIMLLLVVIFGVIILGGAIIERKDWLE